MKRLLCEACGANNLSSENGYIICNYCGSRYLMKEESIKTTSEISIGDDVAKLLAKCKSDPKMHCSMNYNQPKKYAVDGVLYYAKYLKEYYNVIAVAVSGTKT